MAVWCGTACHATLYSDLLTADLELPSSRVDFAYYYAEQLNLSKSLFFCKIPLIKYLAKLTQNTGKLNLRKKYLSKNYNTLRNELTQQPSLSLLGSLLLVIIGTWTLADKSFLAGVRSTPTWYYFVLLLPPLLLLPYYGSTTITTIILW